MTSTNRGHKPMWQPLADEWKVGICQSRPGFGWRLPIAVWRGPRAIWEFVMYSASRDTRSTSNFAAAEDLSISEARFNLAWRAVEHLA